MTLPDVVALAGCVVELPSVEFIEFKYVVCGEIDWHCVET